MVRPGLGSDRRRRGAKGHDHGRRPGHPQHADPALRGLHQGAPARQGARPRGLRFGGRGQRGDPGPTLRRGAGAGAARVQEHRQPRPGPQHELRLGKERDHVPLLPHTL